MSGAGPWALSPGAKAVPHRTVGSFAAAITFGLLLQVALAPADGSPTGAASSAPIDPPSAPATSAAVPLVPPNLGSTAWENWPTYLADNGRTATSAIEPILAPSNASTLTERWQFAVNGSVFSSPSFVNGSVYFTGWNGYVYAVDAAQGTLEWKTFLGMNPYCYVRGIDSSPAIWNGTLFVGGSTDNWYALNLSTGAVEWKVYVGEVANGNENWASPLLYEGYLYIGVASCDDSPLVNGELLQVNLSAPHTVRHVFYVVPSTQLGGSIWSTPAGDPASDTVWVTTGNDNGVDFQPLTQSILALDARTLALRGAWQVPNVAGQDDDFGATPTLFHDATGRLLIGATNKNGVFYALARTGAATDGSWKPVWTVNLGGLLAPAAFDGSRLYLAGGPVMLEGTSYGQSVYALDPADGSILWAQGTTTGPIFGGLSCADGLVVNVAGTDLEVRSAASGVLLAHFRTPFGMAATATIAHGQIFIGDGDSATQGHLYDLGLPLGGQLDTPALPADAPTALIFHANATGGYPPYAFSWEFGDGSTASAADPAHAYSAGGTYTVRVTIADAGGASVVRSGAVTVYPALDAQIEGGPKIVDLAHPVVQVYPSLSGGHGSAYGYLWNFGDGSGSVLNAGASHAYSAPGSYRITLVVTDDFGGRAESVLDITVVDRLAIAANSTPALGEAPWNVSFSSQVAGGSGTTTVRWAFGDGSAPSSGLSVSHTFRTPGRFDVVALARDSLGQVNRTELSVQVMAPPFVDLAANALGTVCDPPRASFGFSASVVGGVAPFEFRWQFGDGTGATGATPSHVYSAGGYWLVQLNVTDGLGGESGSSSTVAVHLDPCLAPPTGAPAASPPPPLGAFGTGSTVGLLLLGLVGAGAAVSWIVHLRRARRGR